MLHLPNPILNEQELALLDNAPEACLQQAVQRGALSLDAITAGLSPRVAAAVQRVASGERPAAAFRSRGEFDGSGDPAPPATPAVPGRQEDEWMRHALSPYADLAHLMDEQSLTPSEAMAAAHAIDRALGRYLTGTRYAAP